MRSDQTPLDSPAAPDGGLAWHAVGTPVQPPAALPATPAGPPPGTGSVFAPHSGVPVQAAPPTTPPLPVKIVVAGGFGVGKTTFVGAVSEIMPLTTEALMTSASVGIDDLSKIATKTTTTVAMDFGRISLPGNVMLYLFGTPGQDRFWFMWDELSSGAIGAVVLVDTRRIGDAFAAIDFFESREIPFVIGVNDFDPHAVHGAEDVREALALGPDTPIVRVDARMRDSAKATLIELVKHALARIA